LWTSRVRYSARTTTPLALALRGRFLVGSRPVGGDFARRSIPCRVDARMAQPRTRTGFRHALPAWARENRGAIVGAVLTLTRAWFAADCPAYTGRVLGSFEAWFRVVGGSQVKSAVCRRTTSLSMTSERPGSERGSVAPACSP